MYYMTTMGETMVCFVVTCMFVRLLGNANKDADNKDKKCPIYIPAWVKKYILGIKDCAKSRRDRSSRYEIISFKDSSPSMLPITPAVMSATLPPVLKEVYSIIVGHINPRAANYILLPFTTTRINCKFPLRIL